MYVRASPLLAPAVRSESNQGGRGAQPRAAVAWSESRGCVGRAGRVLRAV